MSLARAENWGVTTLEIPKSELPPGKTLMVAARPLTSLGTFGKAISTMFNLNSAERKILYNIPRKRKSK